MWIRTLALTTALAGCATATPVSDAPAAPVDDGMPVLAEVRTELLRVRHGQGPAVHAELVAQLEQRPGDKHLLFLDTVAGMPSEVAWQAFKQQAFDEPKDPWPLLAMAMTYVDWSMLPQAAEILDKVEAIKPGFLVSSLIRAQLLQKKSDPGAKAAFEAILARADVPEAHSGLGELALAAGDVATAKQQLALAAHGGAGGLEVQKALAELAKQEHDDPTALSACKEIAAMSPGDGQALAELAKLEEATGDIPGARRDFAKAAELRGIDLDTAQHQVSLARKAGDDKALQDALATLSRVDPKNAAPELELAEILLAQKNPKDAEPHFKTAIEREPTNTKARLELARLLRDGNRTREAIEAYQALLLQTPPPPETQAELDPLIAELKLPDEPLTGDVNEINAKFSREIIKFYRSRLHEKPHLKGTLRLAVDVEADGKVGNVGLTADGLDDQKLQLHAYFVMKQAQFPKAKRTPVFEVELKP